MNLRSDPISSGLRSLKAVHLRLLAELRSSGRLCLAAERLGIAQPAASRLLSEIEALLGLPLHERDGRGLRLTPAGAALALRAERIQLELSDAARDMADLAAGNQGHVRVGSVTGPALDHLLPVLGRLRETAPGLTVEVVVATSDLLCEQVLSGRLDFALGRVPPVLRGQMAMVHLGQEPLGLVVRNGHPLLQRGGVSIDDLMGFDWVMSDDDTLLARTVLRWLSNAGHPPPPRRISTSSFLFTLALLKQSDALAPMALPVIDSFATGEGMPFMRLPFDMDLAVEAYVSFHRSKAALPAAAARVLQMIHDRKRQGAV